MLATDKTVRMHPVDAKTVRVDLSALPTKPLPKAISAYDTKTVRERVVDLAVRPPLRWK